MPERRGKMIRKSQQSADHSWMMADENMVVNAVDPHDGQEKNENNVASNEEVQDDTDEEYATLNAQLDQLNSVLDTLEMKNDVIHAEFVKLLKSNKEVRQQFQEYVKEEAPTKDDSQ